MYGKGGRLGRNRGGGRRGGEGRGEEKEEDRKKEFLHDSKQSELGSPGTAVMEAGLC